MAGETGRSDGARAGAGRKPLPVFLNAYASKLQIVPAQCPPFPPLLAELMQSPPTLYLLQPANN